MWCELNFHLIHSVASCTVVFIEIFKEVLRCWGIKQHDTFAKVQQNCRWSVKNSSTDFYGRKTSLSKVIKMIEALKYKLNPKRKREFLKKLIMNKVRFLKRSPRITVRYILKNPVRNHFNRSGRNLWKNSRINPKRIPGGISVKIYGRFPEEIFR